MYMYIFKKKFPQFLNQIMILSDFSRIKWTHASFSTILENVLGNGAVSKMVTSNLLLSI